MAVIINIRIILPLFKKFVSYKAIPLQSVDPSILLEPPELV